MARATITIAYDDGSEPLVVSGELMYIEEEAERPDMQYWYAFNGPRPSRRIRKYTLSILKDSRKESWDDEWL
jgi:hypothetical protein